MAIGAQATSGAEQPPGASGTHPCAAFTAALPSARPPTPPAGQPLAARAGSAARAPAVPQAGRRPVEQASWDAGEPGAAPGSASRGSGRGVTGDAAPAHANGASRLVPAARAAPEEAAALSEPEAGCGLQPPCLQQLGAQVPSQPLPGPAPGPVPVPLPAPGAGPQRSYELYVPRQPPQRRVFDHPWQQHESGALRGHGSCERDTLGAVGGEAAPPLPQSCAAAYSAWPAEAVRSASAGLPVAAAVESGAWGYGAGGAAAPAEAACEQEAPTRLSPPAAAPTHSAASGCGAAACEPVLPSGAAAPARSTSSAADAPRAWAGEGSAAGGSRESAPASGLQGEPRCVVVVGHVGQMSEVRCCSI